MVVWYYLRVPGALAASGALGILGVFRAFDRGLGRRWVGCYGGVLRFPIIFGLRGTFWYL